MSRSPMRDVCAPSWLGVVLFMALMGALCSAAALREAEDTTNGSGRNRGAASPAATRRVEPTTKAAASTRPTLPEEVARRVAQIETALDKALSTPSDEAVIKLLPQLMSQAQEALELRTKHQGQSWWEATDARQRLEDLQRLSKMSPEQKKIWGEGIKARDKALSESGQGNYQDALALAVKAVELLGEAPGLEHPLTVQSFHNLAAIYQSMGQHAKAAPLYVRALAISERVSGLEHPNAARCLDNLATTYRVLGEYAKAKPLYVRSLTISERVAGPEHPTTASALNNLAALYHSIGQYARAEPLFLRSLKIYERVLPSEHPDTARCAVKLGNVHCSMKEYSKAEPLYLRALRSFEKNLPPEHPHTAGCRDNLARTYASMGQYANPIESTFATVRLRTVRTKGSGSRKACLTMVFKLAQCAQKTWRKLNGSALLPEVIAGVKFIDGAKAQAAQISRNRYTAIDNCSARNVAGFCSIRTFFGSEGSSSTRSDSKR